MIWTYCEECGSGMLSHSESDVFCSQACRDSYQGTYSPTRPTNYRAMATIAAAAFVVVAYIIGGTLDADTATRSADAERENRAAGMAMMEAAR